MRLDDLQVGMRLLGLAPRGEASIISLRWHGDQVAVVFEDDLGEVNRVLLAPGDASRLSSGTPAAPASPRASRPAPSERRRAMSASSGRWRSPE